MRRTPWPLAAFLGLASLLIAVSIAVVWNVLWGLEGVRPDPEPASAGDVAGLALESTKHLVALATAAVGLVGLLVFEKGDRFAHLLTPGVRTSIALGVTLCLVSLVTGFVAMQATMMLARDATILGGIERIALVQLAQLAELGLGFACIAAVLVRAILGPARPEPGNG